jgi:hypothetical protein
MAEEKKSYMPDNTDKPFTGLVREWYNDNTIVLYRLIGVSQEIIDNWAKLVLKTLDEWDKTKPYLAIHDLSQSGVSLQYAAMVNFDMMNIGISMEGRIAAEDIFDQHPNWRGFVAVNFNLSLSGQTNRTLMNFLNRNHPAIQYRSFYNRNKCVRWLSTGAADTQELKALQDGKSAGNTDDNTTDGE